MRLVKRRSLRQGMTLDGDAFEWVAMLYKVTDATGRSGEGIQWGPSVSHRAAGAGAGGSGENFLHACTHPLVAAMLYPCLIGASASCPLLWEAVCDAADVVQQDGMFAVCRELLTLRTVPWPDIAPERRVHFAILCARQTTNDSAFMAWADAWLSGKDRSDDSAGAISLIVGRNRATFLAAKAAAWLAKASGAWQDDVAWATANAARAASSMKDDLDLTTLIERAVPREIAVAFPKLRSGRVPSVEDLAADLRSQQGEPGIAIEDAYCAASQMGDASVKNVVYRDERGNPIGVLRIFLNAVGRPDTVVIAVEPAHRRTGRGVALKLLHAAIAAGFDLDYMAAGRAGYSPEGAALAAGCFASRERLSARLQCRVKWQDRASLPVQGSGKAHGIRPASLLPA